jgi:hypothetical protein
MVVVMMFPSCFTCTIPVSWISPRLLNLCVISALMFRTPAALATEQMLDTHVLGIRQFSMHLDSMWASFLVAVTLPLSPVYTMGRGGMSTRHIMRCCGLSNLCTPTLGWIDSSWAVNRLYASLCSSEWNMLAERVLEALLWPCMCLSTTSGLEHMSFTIPSAHWVPMWKCSVIVWGNSMHDATSCEHATSPSLASMSCTLQDVCAGWHVLLSTGMCEQHSGTAACRSLWSVPLCHESGCGLKARAPVVVI